MKGSVRRQIIAALLISQLLLATTLTVAIVLYSRVQLLSAFDIMLEGRVDSVLATIHYAEDDSGAIVLDQDRLNLSPGDLVEVRDDTGKLVFRSENWQGVPIDVIASSARQFALFTNKNRYRGIVLRRAKILDEDDSPSGLVRKVTIFYAASTKHLDNRVLKVGIFAAGSSFLFLIFAGMFGAYLVTRGLSPVQELAAEAARVSIRNWTFNPPQEARKKQELAPLVNALEATLAGLHRAFNRERESTADGAHELKTAVAILKSSLQLLACQPRSNEDYKEGLDRSLKDCDRLETLVRSTLDLARAEQRAEEGRASDVQDVDLVTNCRQALVNVESLAQTAGVELRCVAEGDQIVEADPDDLQTVWVTLLQNAIQHSSEGSTVVLRVAPVDRDKSLITIEDSGSGIPPDQLSVVFERFRRGDASRSRSTGGFGLGLPICRAIIQAYGGQIEIASSESTGTRVSVMLPALASG